MAEPGPRPRPRDPSSRRLAAPRPSRTPRAPRRPAPPSAAPSSRTRKGAHVSRSVGVGLLAGGAQRTAAAMYASVRVSPSSARREAGRSARPTSWSAAHRKSPEASPVKTRPVRLPPWAAGASPSSRIRASGSPKPGSGRPQYGLVAEPGDLLAGDPLAPRDEPRAAAAGDDLRGQRGEGRPIGHATLRPTAYLSRSLSIRREAIASPTMPMIDRYATWTSRTGEIAPTVSERIRSTPWYSGVIRTNAWSSGGYAVDRVERAGEQEHRQDDELDEVEVLPRLHERRRRHADRPEGEPDQERRRHREDDPRRHEQPEHDHDAHEPDRVERRRGSAPSRARRGRCRRATAASTGST